MVVVVVLYIFSSLDSYASSTLTQLEVNNNYCCFVNGSSSLEFRVQNCHVYSLLVFFSLSCLFFSKT